MNDEKKTETANSDAGQAVVPVPEYIVRDPDGTCVELIEYQEDIFDDRNDSVYRRVTPINDDLLDCEGYGKIIDVELFPYKEIHDGSLNDNMKVEVELTLGALRRLNCLAGFLQDEVRVRNPDMEQIFGQRS